MATHRVGVIGCGGIFQNQHAPYYEQSDRADIVAVSDVDETIGREVADEFDATFHADYHDLLERTDIEAVDVCTPPFAHRDIAVAAARADKHILVEKPMCRDIDEADEMIAAADEAGVRLQVAYVLRFQDRYRKLHELLTDGTLGDVHLAYQNAIDWFTPQHPWLFETEKSGGMLVEQAIHQLDAWLWLYGPVESVYAQTSHVPLGGTYPDPADAVENNAAMQVQFENGGTGVFIKSWAAEVSHSGAGVVCSHGSAVLDDSELRWQRHDNAEETFAEYDRTDDLAPKGRSIDHWLDCIAGTDDPQTSGRVGRRGIAVAQAAYESSDTGEIIRLGHDY